MNKRHPHNPNLTLHFDPEWEGMRVNIRSGPLIHEYLEGIERTLWSATDDHLRVLCVRVDLRLPVGEPSRPASMSRFWERLRSRMAADLASRRAAGRRVHSTCLRYAWVRERNTSENPHYHLVVLVNYDTYRGVGGYDADRGLGFMIRAAWAATLGIELDEAKGLVHFANGSGVVLDVNSGSFSSTYDQLFEDLSYLAKAATKHYGDGQRNFECTRSPVRAAPERRLDKKIRTPSIA